MTDVRKYAPPIEHMIYQAYVKDGELNFECNEKGVLFNGYLLKGSFRVAISAFGSFVRVGVFAKGEDK